MEIALPAIQRARLERVAKFGAVGVVGLGVNLVVQAALIETLHLNYLVSAVLATQVSSTVNFVIAEHWVFDAAGAATPRATRYLAFLGMNNVALLLRGPMMWFLTSELGVHYTVSNLLSLVTLTLIRFGVADGVIWRPAVALATASDVAAPSTYVPVHASVAVEVDDPPDATATAEPETRAAHADRPPRRARTSPEQRLLALVLLFGAVLRMWQLTAVGFNSDEAVYAGQAAAIAGDPDLTRFFPVIRAHPLLFQGLLSIPYRIGTSELVGRLAAVAFGLGTIAVVYLLGRLLYRTRVGLLAALIVAVTPYQVIVSRQVLLDGPTAFFATLSLYLIARYARAQTTLWLVAAAGAAGLAALTKETSVVLFAAILLFLTVSPEIRVRLRDLGLAVGVFVLVLLPFPLTVLVAGRSETGGDYLSWQLFRRPNHSMWFYPTTLFWYVGPLVLVAAVAALVIQRRRRTWSWRERLLLTWMIVPLVYFELWPVKGFHYLLAATIPLAVLAGCALDALWGTGHRPIVTWAAVGLVVVSLVAPTWVLLQPPSGGSLLAGTGGVPGGRETGRWIAEHTPEGTEVMTIGPSMGNLVQFYGHRRSWGLSVSPNPLNRNPSYEPIDNPDRAFATGQVQYVVWDRYSAARSSSFSERLLSYVERYHGHVVHTADAGGEPAVVVYEVRP